MVQIPSRQIGSTSVLERAALDVPRKTRLAMGCAALVCAMSMISSPSRAADSDADNTKRNQHDDAAMTPLDQSNDPVDINIVAAIRRALNDDDSLSTYAQNLKVIVRSGAVTLRGPVNTEAEKARVAQLAKGTQGVVSVDNQISVKH